MKIMNFLKNLIKTNTLMTIVFDYLISFYGFNFEREYELINLVRKKNPIIIDIGGNRGESIKNFLKYKKDAKIYSFEPKKNSFNLIKKKYKKKNISIFNYGIGNLDSTITLYTPTIYNYEFSGLSSIDRNNLKFRLSFFFKKINKNFKFIKEKIEIKKLDNLNLQPDLIKIDTEGSELDVINASLETIKKFEPIIIIEFNHSNFLAINKILQKIGYESYVFNKNSLNLINVNIINKIKRERNLINIVFLKSCKLYCNQIKFKKNNKRNIINFKLLHYCV